jgi:hypothetical protein
MPQIKIKKEFRYAIEGIHVRTFTVGIQDVPDEVAVYAVKDRLAEYEGANTPHPDEIAVPKKAIKREKK